MLTFLNDLMKKPVISLIKLYQKSFSPDHGLMKRFHPHGFCRFYPSCSEYAIQAIDKYGIIKGGLLASWRIVRCNPFNKGGNDPLK